MIDIRDLTVSFPPILPGRARKTALSGLSLSVGAGQCVAVTGSNGCGKSTLCLAVSGLAPRLTGGRLNGHILVAGRDVQQEKPGALADVIGLVMQGPAGQLFNPTVADEIAWGLENLGVEPSAMDERIAKVLTLVGLESLSWDRAPQSLSGGEQKRLALASALALRPAVLILDEPSGGLAPAARTEMINVLQRLRRETSLTLLLTESDPAIIAALADEVIVLHEGQQIEAGHPRAVYLSLSQKGTSEIAIPPSSHFAHVLRAERQMNLSVLTAHEAAAALKSFPLNGIHPQTASSPVNSAPPPAPPAIEIAGLTHAYPGQPPVLHGIDLTIPQGQFVALTGDNGAGKTTLARHLIGLLRPVEGGVRIMGKNASNQSIGQLARQVGFAFQSPELQIFNPTVREEIAFGPKNLGLAPNALHQRVEEMLARFDLTSLADHPPAALSLSARRLVALASIAAMHTPILVLDEPTVGLDAHGQAQVINWLRERNQDGATILLITHDMEIVASVAQRVLVLTHGRWAADGTPAEVFHHLEVLREAGLEPPFAIQFAGQLARPDLLVDLTPEGAARGWLEHTAGAHRQ